jgi:regulatory protein
MLVTAVEDLRRKKEWVRVRFEDGDPIDLPAIAVLKAGLRPGASVDDMMLRELLQASTTAACLDAAYRFLASRPRSRAEVRTRLRRGGYEDGIIETVLQRLAEQSLLDDQQFADYWVEQRTRFSPRSRRAISHELRAKGVESAVVSESTAELDDVETAMAVARDRLRRLNAYDERTQRDRLARFLAQRGYGYGTISTVCRALLNGDPDDSPLD